MSLSQPQQKVTWFSMWIGWVFGQNSVGKMRFSEAALEFDLFGFPKTAYWYPRKLKSLFLIGGCWKDRKISNNTSQPAPTCVLFDNPPLEGRNFVEDDFLWMLPW